VIFIGNFNDLGRIDTGQGPCIGQTRNDSGYEFKDRAVLGSSLGVRRRVLVNRGIIEVYVVDMPYTEREHSEKLYLCMRYVFFGLEVVRR